MKQNKTGKNSKLFNWLIIIESKTNYWVNMSLLQKYPGIGFKIEIFE